MVGLLLGLPQQFAPANWNSGCLPCHHQPLLWGSNPWQVKICQKSQSHIASAQWQSPVQPLTPTPCASRTDAVHRAPDLFFCWRHGANGSWKTQRGRCEQIPRDQERKQKRETNICRTFDLSTSKMFQLAPRPRETCQVRTSSARLLKPTKGSGCSGCRTKSFHGIVQTCANLNTVTNAAPIWRVSQLEFFLSWLLLRNLGFSITICSVGTIYQWLFVISQIWVKPKMSMVKQ